MENISIIICDWNQKTTNRFFLKRLQNCLKDFMYEIIFFRNQSTDSVESKREKLTRTGEGSKKKQFVNTLQEAVTKAHFDILVILDADWDHQSIALADLIKKIQNGSDVVVSSHDPLRNKVSRFFSQTLFSKILFHIPCNLQTDSIVFRKSVVEQLSMTSKNYHRWKLELMHKAKQAGFRMEYVTIPAKQREQKKQSFRQLASSARFYFSALMVRLMPVHPIQFHDINSHSMIQSGARHNGKVYITHSTLHHSQSAIKTFVTKQKVLGIFAAALILFALLIKPVLTIQISIGILSFIYFVDVIFSLLLIGKSLHRSGEITFTDQELSELSDDTLPRYTILCPLYKEAQVFPQFLEAIHNLDYPKKKLDVIILLEEDDTETIETAKRIVLPPYVRTLIVPDSLPKTKPKACNFGLAYAVGDYLVIYDAEDNPDPLQLKKAIVAFRKADRNVICLQAKLNYYNTHQNLLTRFFTAEYSLWFDMTLIGLHALKTTIPLGGTSNHFKTANLRKLEGWDPFNVTEDADLGIRLFKQGYKTAMFDSLTLEEANSRWGNWLRQRSRWIKGYMQTYLVHCRDHTNLIKKTKWHTLIFHLVIGGKIAFILLNPILWTVTICYFTLYPFFGSFIDAVYPTPVLYMAIISLVIGNSLFLFYYMIGCAKKKQWDLIKYIFLIPVYWIMISIAGGIAFFQLILKPHYWEKTVHGLHLKKDSTKIIIEVRKYPSLLWSPLKIRKQLDKLIQLKNVLLEGNNSN